MRRLLGGMTAFGAALFLASSAAALDPVAAGTAAGTMKANGKAVTLRFAQAQKAGNDWVVLLSDVPTSFSEPDEHALVGSGKLHNLTLTIGADGEVSYWRMGHDAMEARFLSMGSVSASKATKMGPTVVEGMARKTSGTYGDNTVEFDVTFKAPIVGK
jgi:hypothetical protein